MMSLKEAAKQALDALEDPWSAGPDGVAAAITALRAALNQERYVVTGNEFHGAPPAPYANWGDAIAAMIDRGVIQGLRISALAEDRSADTGKTSGHFPDAAKMVPPVAYVNDEGWFRHAADADAAFRATAQPLYAAPPKREPLTDAEINGLELPASGTATIRDMVRLIERAHGIGGEE